jgi:predicted N-acetyltransferase YhbS
MPLTLPFALDEQLTLRAVQSDADAEKVIAINDEIHDSEAGDIVRRWLLEGHPNTSRGDWLFIEDETKGQAAATLSLIPMTWCYGGQPLPVAELGFVATRPDYRGRGLQRALSDVFDRMALDRGYALAAIEGIPGFYGQFGYEYAVPLLGGFDLTYEQVPVVEVDEAGYATRRARPEDVPALQLLYDASIAGLDLAASRDRELWTYQLAVPEEITFYASTTVIERAGRVVGYVRWTDDDWTDRLRILELAVDDGPGALERVVVALNFARERGRCADKRGLKLQLPACHPALAVARHLGGADTGYYGWQMKVLDPVRYMRAIGPALEGRLARSVLAGHSGALVFDFYRSRLVLRFEVGRLVEAKSTLNEEPADARMSLKQATQLWLGWRGREALEAWHPDFWTREQARHLLDVLFPKARAYIYMPY